MSLFLSSKNIQIYLDQMDIYSLFLIVFLTQESWIPRFLSHFETFFVFFGLKSYQIFLSIFFEGSISIDKAQTLLGWCPTPLKEAIDSINRFYIEVFNFFFVVLILVFSILGGIHIALIFIIPIIFIIAIEHHYSYCYHLYLL